MNDGELHCSVCLHFDSPFALLGILYTYRNLLSCKFFGILFGVRVELLHQHVETCGIFKHPKFRSKPDTLHPNRPYVFPPVRICFLHPTLTMRKQPTSFPWCAPHFFRMGFSWYLGSLKTLEVLWFGKLWGPEMTDSTQNFWPVGNSHIFLGIWKPRNSMGVSWFPIWRSHIFSNGLVQPWTGKPRRSQEGSLPCPIHGSTAAYLNAGGGLSSWSWSMLGLTSDFSCGGKGLQGCEWHTTICRICIEIYISFYFWDQSCRK